MQQLKEFRSLFKNVAKKYDSLKRRSEAATIQERWASDEMFCLHPFAKELLFKPGRWLNKAPANRFYKYLYKLDANQQPVADTRDFKNEYARQWRETYYFEDQEGNSTIAACFECRVPRRSGKLEIELGTLERLTRKRGLPITFERLNEFSGDDYIRFEYSYTGGRITGVRTAQTEHGESGLTMQYARWNVSYDPDGEVSAIEHADKGRCTIRWPYRRNAKSVTLEQLAKQLEAKLFELVVAAVGKVKVRGKAYGLVLGYSSGGDIALPPYIGIGLEEERDQWIKKLPADELSEMLWNPEEYKHQGSKHDAFTVDDSELESLCGQLLQRTGSRNPLKFTHGILQSVAKKLAGHKWGKSLAVTDDFVVTTYDVDDPDRIATEMKASVPAPILKKFAKQKWV